MANVLIVTTRELGDPMPVFINVIARDRFSHSLKMRVRSLLVTWFLSGKYCHSNTA